MRIKVVALFLLFVGYGRVAAQLEVALQVPQLDLDACLAPQTVEEWRAAGAIAEAEALQLGETLCSVLRRRGVPAEIIKVIDERPGAPFEIGLCFRSSTADEALNCAMLRETNGELRVNRVDTRPAFGFGNR